ncbi:MAG: PAS domain S-box protein [Ferruginibacter sp.]
MNFKKQNTIILAGSFLATIGGMYVIAGWLFGVALWKSILPGYATMNFNVAAAFVLCGVNIWLIFRKRRALAIAARVLSVFIFLIGFITVLQPLFGFNLGIDELFFADTIARISGNTFPGRMANTTALCFSLLGLAFLGILSKKKSVQLSAQYLLHIISVISFIAMIGYLYKVPVFYSLSSLTSMALHTAVMFFVLSIAVSNFHSSLGLTGLFSGNKTGNIMARRLFPLMLLLLLILCFIRLELHRRGLIPVEFGGAVLTISFALVGLLLISITALSLNKIDEKRTAAEDALKLINQNLEGIVQDRTAALMQSVEMLEESNKQNKIFVTQSPNAVAMVDCGMRYIAASDQWLQDYNLVGRDIIGHSHYEIFPHIGNDTKAIHQQCLKECIIKKDESEFIQEDGTARWIKWQIRPWLTSKNIIGGLLMYTEDITDSKRAEEKVKQNELIFSTLFYKSPIVIAINDFSTGKFIDINDAASNFWGYKKEEMVGKTSIELNMIIDPAKRSGALTSIEENGFIRNEEMQYRSRNGKRWLSVAADLINLDGKDCFVSAAIDITDRKEAEAGLSNLQVQYHQMIDVVEDYAILQLDKTGTIKTWNRGAQKIKGYTAEEIIGMNLSIFYSQEDRKAGLPETLIKEATLNKKAIAEGWRIRKDKSRFWANIVITALTDQAGNVTGFTKVTRDLTDKKNAEEELNISVENLRINEQKFISLIESSPDAMVVVTKERIIKIVNLETEKLFGYTRAELIGQNGEILIPEKYRPKRDSSGKYILDPVESSMNTKKELCGRKKDGTEFPIEMNVGLLEEQELYSCSIRDVSERKKNEQKFIALLESAPDAMVIVNKERIIQIVNLQTEKLFGYSRDELIGQSNGILLPEKYKPKRGADGKYISDIVARSMGSGEEMYGMRKDGTEFPMEMSISHLEHEGLYVGVLRDVTERKSLELAQTTFFNMSHEMLAVAGTNGYFKHINQSFEKTLGFSNEELLSKSFLNFIHPDDVADSLKEIEKLSQGLTTINFLNRCICKDGRYKLLEWTCQPLGETIFATARDVTERRKKEEEIREIGERNKIFVSKLPGAVAMFDTHMRYLAASDKWIADYDLASKEIIGKSHYEIFPEIGADWKTIHRECLNGAINKCEEAYFQRADGTSQWITWDIRPWYSSEGIIGGILIFTADITDRKQAAEKEKKYAIMESKSREMEQFVYVASHDLREPLLTLKNYAKIFIEDYGNQVNADALKYLISISSAANRMDALIKGLLDYSRLSQAKQVEEVDCNEILKLVKADLSLLINKNKAIIHTGILPILQALPLELKLLFQNLLSNAIKFNRGGVSPVINIIAKKIDNGWQFEFKDNGIGIADADKEKIFIIFQRLHDRNEYEGTGIGLAHCKKIVELHHGKIWVESVAGEGSTFYFTIIT